jgi:hypothetical protein
VEGTHTQITLVLQVVGLDLELAFPPCGRKNFSYRNVNKKSIGYHFGSSSPGDEMRPGSESQCRLEAVRLTNIISARTIINTGTWNVRTMFKTGKSTQVQPLR